MPGADRGDHGLDFRVLQHLVQARLLDVDQLAADRQNRLIAPVAPLLGGATGGVTLDNVQLGQARIALRTIGQLAGQAAAGQRAFADGFASLARGFARAGGSQALVDDPLGHRRASGRRRSSALRK